jgi:hypothetical protein
MTGDGNVRFGTLRKPFHERVNAMGNLQFGFPLAVLKERIRITL